MPEPVFRTTEGVTPKTARDRQPDDPADGHDLNHALIDQMPEPEPAEVHPPAAVVRSTKAGSNWGTVFVAVLAVLIVAAIIAAAFYFYFDLKPKPWF